MVLVELLRPALARDEKMGALRNGAIAVEYQVGLTLRWLAGASMYEGMVGISDSVSRHQGIDCVSATRLQMTGGRGGCQDCEGVQEPKLCFVMKKCVGAMDGLFIRMTKPSMRGTTEPNLYFSGHKKGFGMNFQV
ncbi:unnamed protein product, partial [Hapterophycus canaliculatus]